MRQKISKSKYRALLTEVLPYEMPLFFSNKSFVRFLKYHDVTIKDGKLTAQTRNSHTLSKILEILSGSDEEITNFNYTISNDGNADGRILTVMHPLHQIMAAGLYEKYQSLIIHFCDKSQFSIRRPWRVASEILSKSLFEEIISDDPDTHVSPDSAKSYFIYKKYSNISRFYDDYDFLHLERNFEYLLKIDIAKCFDSINPDDLPLLVYETDYKPNEYCENDFIFDFIKLHKVIRNGLPVSNPKHEKGIIIGPEVSRIFAEIFLQHIDFIAERRLREEFGFTSPKDYMFYRYVDDSFIAANSIEAIRQVKRIYSCILGSVGMTLKENKESLYRQRPFVNSLSLIKSKLKDLVDETFENKLSTFKGFKDLQNGRYDAPTQIEYRSFVNQLRLIVAEARFYIQEHSIGRNDESAESLYRDISSFVLGCIVNRMETLLKEFNELYRDYSELEKKGIDYAKGLNIKTSYEIKFKEFCEDLIESLFFLLSSDLRMATSITVVKIVDILQRFVRGEYIFSDNLKSAKFPSCFISGIDERITKETLKLLRHKRTNGSSGLMELLNLLELQHLMYPRNRINEKSLLSFLEKNNVDEQLNYFTAFQLIHFTQGKKRYNGILSYVTPWLYDQSCKFISTMGSDTESLLTVISVLSAPLHYRLQSVLAPEFPSYLDFENTKISKILQKSGGLFINWNDYSVSKELEQRKGHNVY